MNNDIALQRFKKNENFLSDNPSNLETLPDLFQSQVQLELFEEGGGRYNIAVKTEEGHIPYHRSVDPFGEFAGNFSENDNKEIAVVLGTGFGYHLLSAIEELKKYKKVYFVEPYFPALFIFMTELDLELFLDDNFEILFCQNPQELADFLKPKVNHYHNTDITFLSLDSLQKLYPDFFSETVAELQSTWEKHLIFLVSQQQQVDEIISNTISNIAKLPGSSSIVHGSAAGKTALITGSGPSLSSHIDLLPKCSDEHYIISLGSSHAVLDEAGVVPDITVISDPQELNKLHFPKPEYESRLIADIAVYPEISEKFITTKTFVNIGHSLPGLFEEECKLGFINNWGTVTSTGLDLCRKLGFSRVLLLGAEFSYIQDDSHAENYSLTPINKNGNFEWVKDATGKTVKTTPIMKSYADFVDKQIKELVDCGMEIINCNDGGLIFNAPLMSLRHALHDFSQKDADKLSPDMFFTPKNIGAELKTNIVRKINLLKKEVEVTIQNLGNNTIPIRDVLNVGFISVLEGKFWRDLREIEAAEISGDPELKKSLVDAIYPKIMEELDSILKRFNNAIS